MAWTGLIQPIHQSVRSSIHRSIDPSIHLFIQSDSHSLTHPPTRSIGRSLTHTCESVNQCITSFSRQWESLPWTHLVNLLVNATRVPKLVHQEVGKHADVCGQGPGTKSFQDSGKRKDFSTSFPVGCRAGTEMSRQFMQEMSVVSSSLNPRVRGDDWHFRLFMQAQLPFWSRNPVDRSGFRCSRPSFYFISFAIKNNETV